MSENKETNCSGKENSLRVPPVESTIVFPWLVPCLRQMASLGDNFAVTYTKKSREKCRFI